MRMFLLAAVVVVVGGVAADAVLNIWQKPVAVAFATPGARVDIVE